MRVYVPRYWGGMGGFYPQTRILRILNPQSRQNFGAKLFQARKRAEGNCAKNSRDAKMKSMYRKNSPCAKMAQKWPFLTFGKFLPPPKTSGTQIWPMLPDRACDSLSGSIA